MRNLGVYLRLITSPAHCWVFGGIELNINNAVHTEVSRVEMMQEMGPYFTR